MSPIDQLFAEQDVWTPEELAGKLRVHPNTIRRAIESGCLEADVIRSGGGRGGAMRIYTPAILAWRREHCRPTPAPKRARKRRPNDAELAPRI